MVLEIRNEMKIPDLNYPRLKEKPQWKWRNIYTEIIAKLIISKHVECRLNY